MRIVFGCSISSVHPLIRNWLDGVVWVPSGQGEPNNVVLGDRNHLQITFLQSPLQRRARSKGGDLRARDFVLHSQIGDFRLKRFLAITQMVKLKGKINVA